eukprot:30247_1
MGSCLQQSSLVYEWWLHERCSIEHGLICHHLCMYYYCIEIDICIYHYQIKSCDHGCSNCGSGHYDKELYSHGCYISGSDCIDFTHFIQSIIPDAEECMRIINREIAPAATLHTPKQTLYIVLNPTDEPCKHLCDETEVIHWIYCLVWIIYIVFVPVYTVVKTDIDLDKACDVFLATDVRPNGTSCHSDRWHHRCGQNAMKYMNHPLLWMLTINNSVLLILITCWMRWHMRFISHLLAFYLIVMAGSCQTIDLYSQLPADYTGCVNNVDFGRILRMITGIKGTQMYTFLCMFLHRCLSEDRHNSLTGCVCILCMFLYQCLSEDCHNSLIGVEYSYRVRTAITHKIPAFPLNNNRQVM